MMLLCCAGLCGILLRYNRVVFGYAVVCRDTVVTVGSRGRRN